VIVAESPKNCPKSASAEDVSVNYYSDLRSTIYDADGSLLAEGFAQSAANAFIAFPEVRPHVSLTAACKTTGMRIGWGVPASARLLVERFDLTRRTLRSGNLMLSPVALFNHLRD
jgi:hypothetical protein